MLRSLPHSLCSILAPLAAALALTSCIGGPGAQTSAQMASLQNPPVIYPTETRQLSAQHREGSLFNPASDSWSPWSEVTAQAVGDLVTVSVTINTNAEGTATTDVSRNSEIEANIDYLFGKQMTVPGAKASGSSSSSTPQTLLKSTSTSTFKGDGDTKRTGKIVADISCVVTQVSPNGNLTIHGSQSTLINHENSILTVDGIIRRADISSNNVITSDRIANSRIEITGRGVLSDKQKPGLWMRAFDWIWPF